MSGPADVGQALGEQHRILDGRDLAPVIVSANTAVALASELRRLPAITLALATSDVPGGVVNVITGRTADVTPWIASERDVNAIDLAGAARAEGVAWGDLELAAADNSSGCCDRRATSEHRRA